MGTGLPCIGLGPKESHFLTPFQWATGCGAFQRRSPTGGAAKGIPLKAVTSPELLFTPDTIPASVLATINEVDWPVLSINEYKNHGALNIKNKRLSLVCF